MPFSHACITGLGAVTPLGADAGTSWRELLSGRLALRTGAHGIAATLADYPVGAACLEEAVAREGMDRRALRRLDPISVQALVAAAEAVRDAGLKPPLDRSRAAVVMGVGFGAAKSHYYIASMCIRDSAHRMSPFAIPSAMPNSAAANVCLAYGVRGPSLTVATACAAGLDATGLALWLIQSGQADLVLAGGTENIADDIGVGGMGAARALARAEDGDVGVLRPFDRRRKGTVVGEGAAILVLESPEHAAARGARVRARLLGYGNGSDAYHITQPRPDGSGAAEVMRRALAAARLAPEQVDAVFAHGTGTPLNDVMEGRALAAVFGERLPLVTSPKAQFGHAMGASGPINLVFAVHALEEQLVPATVTCTEPDPECLVEPVREEPREARLGHVMVNAFGFGGHNGSLVLGRA